jgi:pyruvate dehydrogenase E1 component beta subunit
VAVITYREALTQALREELQRDENVFIIGEEVGLFEGAYKVTQGLYREFGDRRIKDAPISEEAFVGAAIGAAMVGLRPVVELMTVNFSLVAIDQIVNNAAKIHYMFGGQTSVPVVIRTPGGAGHQLAAQHSQNFDSWFANVPGLLVVVPSTPYDAKGMLKTAIRGNNPVIFMENLALYNVRGEVPDEDYTVPFGKAAIRRNGRDVTILGTSRMVSLALEAARTLETRGIEAEVIDIRSLRPLDVETIAESVRRTSRAVVVEEGWPTFGVASTIAAVIQEEAFDFLDAPVQRVGLVEVPMPYAKTLERAAIPSVQTVLNAVNRIVPGRHKEVTHA